MTSSVKHGIAFFLPNLYIYLKQYLTFYG